MLGAETKIAWRGTFLEKSTKQPKQRKAAQQEMEEHLRKKKELGFEDGIAQVPP